MNAIQIYLWILTKESYSTWNAPVVEHDLHGGDDDGDSDDEHDGEADVQVLPDPGELLPAGRIKYQNWILELRAFSGNVEEKVFYLCSASRSCSNFDRLGSSIPQLTVMVPDIVSSPPNC